VKFRDFELGAIAAAFIGGKKEAGRVAPGRLMRLATYCSVAVALSLIVAKLTAWAATGSVALLSTLADSTLDGVTAVLNLVAVNQSLQPADNEHRFGHGKAEPLAGLGQSAFIAGAALFVIGEAAYRLITPRPMSHIGAGIAVMIISLVLTALLLRFQHTVVRATGSLAIRADQLHQRGDLLAGLAVIAALLLDSQLGWWFADPLFAALIAGGLLWSAAKIALASIDALMDHEFPEADRQRIIAICRLHPMVRDVHDLRTRTSGQQSFIQLHLELDPSIMLAAAHVISDEVEANIAKAFPNAEVITHQDPTGIEEPRAGFGR
jgi:ferrous-iron efflux pump FieF